jgi:LmbE family N-acetylglucosaminyl deacetylase
MTGKTTTSRARHDHPVAGPHGPLSRSLPAAHSVLAVVARPGDEACYLGAILEIFHRQGCEVGVLAFSRGDAAPYNDSLQPLDSIRVFEFAAAASVLGAGHRMVVDYPENELCRLPVERLADHVTRMIREWAVDLIVTVDGRLVHRSAAAAACCAGRDRGIPVLAWTLPHEVARLVTKAGGLRVTGDPAGRIDFEVGVRREVQRRAMRAHQSQNRGDGVQFARLDIQGDREWLRWLVPAAVRRSCVPEPEEVPT